MKISLRCSHAQTVKDCTSSHKINYVKFFSKIINFEGHLNRFIGSKGTAILVSGGILPTGGVACGGVACAAGLFSPGRGTF